MPSSQLLLIILLFTTAGLKGFTIPNPVLPDADFSSSDTLIAREGCVRFYDQSVGNPVSWHWAFEGGLPSESIDPDPVIIYPDAGIFDVILVVANETGTDTVEFQDYVTVTEYPTGWDCTTTFNSHVISVPVTSNPSINDDVILPGDLVGVYYISAGDTLCGGYSTWDGQQNIAVTAFGDDPFTQEKDGFTTGEEFIWRLFSWSIRKDYTGTATYSFGSSYFVPGGLSAVSTLNASGPLYYRISGHVETESGDDLNQVFLSFGNDVCPALTKPDGNYLRSVPSGWSDTVQPLLTGNIFTPLERVYENISSHQSDQDYTASAIFIPPGWNYTETSITHSIAIPTSASPSRNGIPLVSGDVIGAFYYNPATGVEKCAGLSEWSSSEGSSITAYGDDPATTQKDGFTSSELIRWKVYRLDEGSNSDGIAVYDNLFPDYDGLFHADGSSGLSDLFADDLHAEAFSSTDSICMDQSFYLQGDATGGSGTYTYSWVSVPPGFISFDPDTLVSPTATRDYILTVTTFNDTSSDTVSVFVQEHPDVILQSSDTLCENESLLLSGTQAYNYSSIQWTTSGDGVFDNDRLLNPVYSPGDGDILSGNVALTIKAYGSFPCGDSSSALIEVQISRLPEVFAGNDTIICENDSFHAVHAYSENYSAIQWSSTGDGDFEDAQLMNCIYHPGINDLENGAVGLILKSFGKIECDTTVEDTVHVIIQLLPSLNAGTDITICAGDACNNQSATASNYSNLYWTTSGDGSFNDSSLLLPVYTPGVSDLQNSSVNLILHSNSLDPCTLVVTDTAILNISSIPMVEAGPDTLIELNDTIMLQGQINGNGQTITDFYWTPQTGLSSPLTINPLAYPDSTVTFILTALNETNCFNTDSVKISVIPPGWDYEPTGRVHAINIPVSAYLEIDSNNLNEGDYIAVFYRVNDMEMCGGYGVWNENEDIIIHASGDNITTGEKDGFGDDEPFNWKIFQWNTKTEVIAFAVFDSSYSDYDGKYTEGAISALSALSGFSGLKNHILQLSQDWSGISSYLDPVDPDVVKLFQPVEDHMIILQQQSYIYWPAFNINTIINWDSHKGFVIKMSAPDYLFVTGFELSDKSISIPSGWSDIPVLSDSDVASDDVFLPLGDKLVIVTEIAGSKVYWPSMGIKSLEFLNPGKSYYILVNESVTFEYPE
jgi:PKD repeat protein